MSRHLRATLWLGSTVAAAYCFWPPSLDPVRFWMDSFEYLHWPRPLVQSGVVMMGARPVGYPATLHLTGTGGALSHFQTWISVGSWALLGWTVARAPGLVFALVLAYSSPVRLWNAIVLTESLTLSLMVLLIALATVLVRHWDWRIYFAWLVCTVWFILMRDSDVVLVPFLIAPLALCGRRRFMAALIPVILVSGVSAWHAGHEVRWKVGYQTSILTRVMPRPESVEHFVNAGMPAKPFAEDREEFLHWFGKHGRSVYTGWFLREPESYWRPWEYLYRGSHFHGRPRIDLVNHLNRKYFEDLQPYRGPATDLADHLFRWTAPPIVLALALCLIPLLEWYWRGSVGLLSLWIPLLTGALMVHGFATFNLSGSAHARHILPSSLLLRLLPLFAAAALWECIRRPGQRRGIIP